MNKQRAMTTTLAVCGGLMTLGSVAGTASAHPFGWRINESIDGNLQIEFLWERTHKAWTTVDGYNGIVDNALNFEEVLADRPEDGIYALSEGAKIQVVIDSFDAGVFYRAADDLSTTLSNPGESWSVGTGGSGFITPAFWQMDPTAEGFDPDKGIWEASFHIVDLSGQLGRSPTYTFLLEPDAVPAPATAALMGLGGLACTRRRR